MNPTSLQEFGPLPTFDPVDALVSLLAFAGQLFVAALLVRAVHTVCDSAPRGDERFWDRHEIAVLMGRIVLLLLALFALLLLVGELFQLV